MMQGEPVSLEAIEAVAALSLDELLERAGAELEADSFGMSEGSPVERKLRAQVWFGDNRAKLANAICSSSTVQLYRKNPQRWDRALLLAALMDCVYGKVVGIAPLTAAALAVRVGVDELCPDCTND